MMLKSDIYYVTETHRLVEKWKKLNWPNNQPYYKRLPIDRSLNTCFYKNVKQINILGQ